MLETYSALFRKSAIFSEVSRISNRDTLPPSYINLIRSFIDLNCASSFSFAAARSSLAFSTCSDIFSILPDVLSSFLLSEARSLFMLCRSSLRSDVFFSRSFVEGAAYTKVWAEAMDTAHRSPVAASKTRFFLLFIIYISFLFLCKCQYIIP